ncbi:MAG: TolC family protein [Kofleriaceae bacterium]
MRLCGYLVALLVLATPVGAHADATTPADAVIATAEELSLDDLLRAAVRAAPQLQAAAFDVELARANLRATKGVEDLTLAITGGVARVKAPSPLTGDVSTTDTTSATAALRRLLPTNGTLELLTTMGSTRTRGATETSGRTADLTLRLAQPLLAGVGPATAKVAIRSAAHRRDAATIRRTASARSFVASVVSSYWQLALAWRELEVRRSSLEAAKKQLAAIERGLKTGALAKSEQTPFEQQIAAQQIDILNAERDIMLRSLDLRRVVGLEIAASSLAIRTAPLPTATPFAVETGDLLARALAASDELGAAMAELRAARAVAEASQRDLLPRLDLTVEGGISGAGASVGAAFGDLDGDAYSISANVAFELPFGRNTAKGTHAANRTNIARARFDLYAQREAIAADVVRLAYEARTSQLTLVLGEKEIALAQQNVEAEQRKFELGKSTANEIVRRQNDLENGRLRHAALAASYAITLTELDAATGEILPRFGIKMRDSAVITDEEMRRPEAPRAASRAAGAQP